MTLEDKGLVRVLYVAPSRKLVRKKNADYAITANVLSATAYRFWILFC